MRSIENRSTHNKSLLELLYPRHEFTQIFSPVNLNFEKEKTFPTLFPLDRSQSYPLSFKHNKDVVKIKYNLIDLGKYNFSTLAKFKTLFLCHQLLNFPKMWDFTWEKRAKDAGIYVILQTGIAKMGCQLLSHNWMAHYCKITSSLLCGILGSDIYSIFYSRIL